MNLRFQKFANVLPALTLLAGLAVGTAFGADQPQSFSGQVSDAMCGPKHMMADPAECTRACVKKGSKYGLVVKDKVYTLDTSDAAAADKLDKLAGQQAKVTGTANGDTIAVKSVSAAK
jgi:hypothetical protein